MPRLLRVSEAGDGAPTNGGSTPLSADNDACHAWLEGALRRLRPGGQERIVGYLEGVQEEVLFETKAPPRAPSSGTKAFRRWEEVPFLALGKRGIERRPDPRGQTKPERLLMLGSHANGRNEQDRLRPGGDESGIIVFGGGGGRGCLGGGCLFWILLSVALAVLVNLLLLMCSGGGSGVGV